MSTNLQSLANKKFNVLIVEDFESWRRKFKRFLQDEPFNLLIASNYNEGEAIIERHPIDLVVLDVNLSGVPYNIDGLRLAEKLWRINEAVKIVIVTGSHSWHQRKIGYQFEPSFVLKKQNLDQDDFIQKVYQALES